MKRKCPERRQDSGNCAWRMRQYVEEGDQSQMINYEEELKKFHPSMDVNEAEDAIYSRDLTDVTDILKEMMKEEKKNRKQGS
jgi:hypothetical protein